MSFKKILLLILVTIGIILRLQNFHLQPIDAHAMRQTDTESVAYNFAFHDHWILYPQNSLIRPQSNIHSYFFLEFPAYEYLLGMGYMAFGWHMEVARIINLLLFVSACFALYFFVKKFINENTAWWTTVFFTFSPASIFFIGHAFHPDVFAIATLLYSLALYIRWKESKQVWLFALSLICFALAVATRPFIVIVLPAFLFLAWTYKAKWWEYPFLALFPFSLYGGWKLWQRKFPEADSTWENWVLQGQALLFKVAVLRNLIMKNIVGEVVGKVIFAFSALGAITILVKRNKVTIFLLFWLAGVPAYWYFAPNGNLYHQYYANVYLVPLLMLAAVAVVQIGNLMKKKLRPLALVLGALLLLLTIYNGYRTSDYYFRDITPDSQLKIAKVIAEHIPADARLVYTARLNPLPFSLSHRKGWIIGVPLTDVQGDAISILHMKEEGANYIVYAKTNNDLAPEDLKLIEMYTNKFYEDQYVKIFTYR